MKKIIFIAIALVISAAGVSYANPTVNTTRGYGSSIIFTEGNVEFAVFPDGQFDFYYHPQQVNVTVNTPTVNISYNAGYNYDPYIQYDDYGAVIQIENVPVFYDYYGRIIQAGNVYITYNNYGRVARVGGLYLHYDTYGHFSYFRGYINRGNRHYVYHPWHRFYIIPPAQRCIVYERPYRAYYAPRRISYTVYRNNYANNRSNRSFYRPYDQVTRYSNGTRTTGRRTIAPTRVNTGTVTRTSTVNRTNSNYREITRSNQYRTSIADYLPTNSDNSQRSATSSPSTHNRSTTSSISRSNNITRNSHNTQTQEPIIRGSDNRIRNSAQRSSSARKSSTTRNSSQTITRGRR